MTGRHLFCPQMRPLNVIWPLIQTGGRRPARRLRLPTRSGRLLAHLRPQERVSTVPAPAIIPGADHRGDSVGGGNDIVPGIK